MDDQVIRDELEATLEARKELGPGHDDDLVTGFLERIDKEIDRRVDERLARHRHRRRGLEAEIGVFVPLLIIAGIFGGAAGIFAIAGVLLIVVLIQTIRS